MPIKTTKIKVTSAKSKKIKSITAAPKKAAAGRKIKLTVKKVIKAARLKKKTALSRKQVAKNELRPALISTKAMAPRPAGPLVLKPEPKPETSVITPEVSSKILVEEKPKSQEALLAKVVAAPPVVSEVEPLFPKKEVEKVIEVKIPIALKDLALSLQEKPVVLIKKLLDHKIIANLNFPLEEELAKKFASLYGYQLKRKPTEEELLFKEHEIIDPAKLKPRPPIVTFMGHVDHGKTSLLDAIRKSKVAESEYGGITQHIGAYSVSLAHGRITFLDTPGHEAFSAMRARGAKVTDIVVLVVAADDGIMPQTIEAIDHAKAAQAPIMVAINKIDKAEKLNIDMVKKQLSELGLASEDWGGKTITVGVSAKTGEGIDELLEMILLEAEMLELKADPTNLASGVVLESKISEGKGPVATLLVENGTLKVQDAIIVGPYYAKVRALFNEFGKGVLEAPPSGPVEILRLSGMPESGEKFFVLSDEKKAKELAAKRKMNLRERGLKPVKMLSLEEFSEQIKEGKVKELKLILKADVGGSLEAINESLKKLASSEVKLSILHQGAGSINVSDVILAEASGAIVLGFHVTGDERSKAEADKAGIDIRTYNVIYELVNDLKIALEGLLEPKLKKIPIGRILVRQVFKLSKSGIIAGSYVEKGKVTRSAKVSLLRNGGLVYEGSIQSLKRFKDDVLRRVFRAD